MCTMQSEQRKEKLKSNQYSNIFGGDCAQVQSPFIANLKEPEQLTHL